jgi:hypothetical protein
VIVVETRPLLLVGLLKPESVPIGSTCSKTLARLWRECWHVIWLLIGTNRQSSSQPPLSKERKPGSQQN